MFRDLLDTALAFGGHESLSQPTRSVLGKIGAGRKWLKDEIAALDAAYGDESFATFLSEADHLLQGRELRALRKHLEDALRVYIVSGTGTGTGAKPGAPRREAPKKKQHDGPPETAAELRAWAAERGIEPLLRLPARVALTDYYFLADPSATLEAILTSKKWRHPLFGQARVDASRQQVWRYLQERAEEAQLALGTG